MVVNKDKTAGSRSVSFENANFTTAFLSLGVTYYNNNTEVDVKCELKIY